MGSPLRAKAKAEIFTTTTAHAEWRIEPWLLLICLSLKEADPPRGRSYFVRVDATPPLAALALVAFVAALAVIED
jgi:hypothetical protein